MRNENLRLEKNQLFGTIGGVSCLGDTAGARQTPRGLTDIPLLAISTVLGKKGRGGAGMRLPALPGMLEKPAAELALRTGTAGSISTVKVGRVAEAVLVGGTNWVSKLK